ncbi:MAG: bifunctional adenosylcobinamide kinase/adenosylcobinamide-phosphate guanylyltransferase [Alphaproteobacteria bacterium]
MSVDTAKARLSRDPPRSTLVLGGARSGKSAHAEALAAAAGQPIYLATGAARDAEMADRIALHRARRGPAWTTIEEPLDLTGALAGACAPGRAVVVDCLTLWLANLLGAERDAGAESERLIALLPRLAGRLVFVSNEVGLGIVPENALARAFRDAQGRLNQSVARAVETVVLVAAGLPIVLKQGPSP